MECEIIEAHKQQIILEDGSQYFYTIKPVEITNILGTTTAVLDEYLITNIAGETLKLYKTKEDNWYDIADVNAGADNGLLLALKMALNSFSKTG
ncbi:hypothetical protein [Ferruginibacter sp.]|nr:hypothetical protein [Ferruginibacter sp.]